MGVIRRLLKTCPADAAQIRCFRTVRHAGDTLDLLRFVYALLLAIAFGADGAESVGSQACASCHAGIYRSFIRTQMAQSSGRVGAQESKEQFDRPEFRDSSGAFAYTVGA